MDTIKIAVIPGDGIGTEVMPEGLRVLEAVGALHGIEYSWTNFDWSCEHYARTGAMMMQHLGYNQVHDCVMAAVEQVLREGQCLTRDMGGSASTQELGAAIAGALE
jgi:isocitrate/isopropylmalate dehydrogenase